MALFSLISGTCKNIFFLSFSLYFSLYLTSLKTAKTIFIKFTGFVALQFEI